MENKCVHGQHDFESMDDYLGEWMQSIIALALIHETVKSQLLGKKPSEKFVYQLCPLVRAKQWQRGELPAYGQQIHQD